MKEILEIRVNLKYAHLLFKENEGINLGDSVKKISIDTMSPVFHEVGEMQEMIRKKYNALFFYGWAYKRVYTEEEMKCAKFFQVIPTRFFEPEGEECGTIYDDTKACPVCGSGAKLLSALKLRKSSIPKTDMAETIARGEEIIVSERFKSIMEENHITGVDFLPVYQGGKKESQRINSYQIHPQNYFDLSAETKVGIDPYNFSGGCEEFTSICARPDRTLHEELVPRRIYKCPNGDNMGLNILSEAYVRRDSAIDSLDFFASRQTIGAKMGVVRPTHLLFCSNRMMQIIKKNKLRGACFEVAHIVDY